MKSEDSQAKTVQARWRRTLTIYFLSYCSAWEECFGYCGGLDILINMFPALSVSFAILFLSIGSVFAQVCIEPPPNMVSWWPLDETSGTVAGDIAGTNSGVHVNGPMNISGKVAGALQFDGVDDFVRVPDSDLWAFGSNDFTIEFWVKFFSPGGGTIGHPSHIFVGNDEGSGLRAKWFFALGGGFLNFHINSPLLGPQFFPLAAFSPRLINGTIWLLHARVITTQYISTDSLPLQPQITILFLTLMPH